MGKLRLEAHKPFRKIATDKYRAYMDGYVKSILGRPMENLSVSMRRKQHVNSSHDRADVFRGH